MKKSLLIIVAAILNSQLAIFAYGYKVNLLDEAFKGVKYDFSITKIVDGRLNKKKPMGTILGFSFTQEPVENDSLGDKMNMFFKNKPEMFNNSIKIILVLNQCNFSNYEQRSMFTGKVQNKIFTVSFDYYKLNENNTYTLVYQQYFIHTKNTDNIAKLSKGINLSFSETVKVALLDFNNQLKLKPSIASEEITSDSLFNFLNNRHSQLVTNQNIKDGLYFSCKDLYLNKSGIIKDFLIDTVRLEKKPASIKIKANNYIVEKAYAIVRQKHIYIYIDNNFYKEALLDDNGNLFFPDVTSSTISKGAKVGSATVGLISVFSYLIPFGGTITGAFVTGATTAAATQGAQYAIGKSGTTKATSDIIIDFETGDLEKRNSTAAKSDVPQTEEEKQVLSLSTFKKNIKNVKRATYNDISEPQAGDYVYYETPMYLPNIGIIVSHDSNESFTIKILDEGGKIKMVKIKFKYLSKVIQ